MRVAGNAEESGVKAWMRMIAHDDQRQGPDVSTETSGLMWTNESFGKATNLEEAKINVNGCEQEMTRFEQKHLNRIIDEELETKRPRLGA